MRKYWNRVTHDSYAKLSFGVVCAAFIIVLLMFASAAIYDLPEPWPRIVYNAAWSPIFISLFVAAWLKKIRPITFMLVGVIWAIGVAPLETERALHIHDSARMVQYMSGICSELLWWGSAVLIGRLFWLTFMPANEEL